MGKLEIIIYDDQWPKLRLVGTYTTPTGEACHFDAKVNYDRAYTQFEGSLHNALRKVVDAVISRRKSTRV